MKATLQNGMTIVSDDFGKHVVRQVLRNSYEPELTAKFLDSIDEDSVVLDVGAGIGYYSLLASPKAKWVIAFEPHPGQRKLLHKNISDNGLPNVEVEPVALWDEDKTGFIGTRPAIIQNHGILVDLRKLDGMGLGAVDVVKIDVEGAEFHVLTGMFDTLAQYAPTLFVEVHPSRLRERGVWPATISEFLEGAGYKTTHLASYEGHYHLEAT